ncbi:hypothetical protein B9G39_08520 [Zooshikella ganghwensis]|uniref:Uncharacterized protein n=1 Tax=Zooshikella ganghwensis TaxID=202772 RepID=A0A4P9VLP4_9GAMM|nr:hypothetical protein B9G39_08520 [Zooshikella ganghwensis]
MSTYLVNYLGRLTVPTKLNKLAAQSTLGVSCKRISKCMNEIATLDIFEHKPVLWIILAAPL